MMVLSLTGLPGPLRADDDPDIPTQIEQNWNVAPRSEECADRKIGVIELRIHLTPDGTITKVEPLNLNPSDMCASAAYEAAKRAVMLASPLQLPPGKTYATMTLRFYPDQVMQ